MTDDDAADVALDMDAPAELAAQPVTRRLRTPAWRTEQQRGKRACRGLCPLNCRMGCRTKFSLARLHDIWESFYSMNFDARRQWVYSFVSRKTRSDQRPHYIYHLPDEQNNRVAVCCKLFNRYVCTNYPKKFVEVFIFLNIQKIVEVFILLNKVLICSHFYIPQHHWVQ